MTDDCRWSSNSVGRIRNIINDFFRRPFLYDRLCMKSLAYGFSPGAIYDVKKLPIPINRFNYFLRDFFGRLPTFSLGTGPGRVFFF